MNFRYETEYLKTVEMYYSEILKMKNNIIDYLTQYNDFTKDYLKNLINLQINKAKFFEAYTSNKNCDLSEL